MLDGMQLKISPVNNNSLQSVSTEGESMNTTMEEDSNSHEGNQSTEITMFYATAVKAKCPACDSWLEGWTGDPRRSEEDNCDYCDYCGAPFTVHPDADLEFDY